MKNFYYNLNGGLNTQSTAIALGAETKKLYWCDAYNVEPYKNQGITRQKGSRLIAKVPGGEKITGLKEYPKGTKNFVVICASGKIYHFDAEYSRLNLIYTYEKEIEDACFTYFLDGLVIIPNNAKGIYYKLDGKTGTVSPINAKDSSGADIYAHSAAQFGGRLFLAQDDTVYFSALGTYDDWTSPNDAGYISKFHSSTGKIVALKEYAGSLAIYKNQEVFLLSGNDSETFVITKFADKGTLGHSSVLTCNNKQYFAAENGVFALSQAGELSQIVMGSNIANPVSSYFISMYKKYKNLVKVIPYEAKNAVWFFVPLDGGKCLNQVLIYDYTIDCWYRRLIPYEITSAECVGGEIYTSSAQGCVYVENSGNTFASKNIEFKLTTPFFHFQKPSTPKIIEDFNMIFDGVSENTFKFSISKDYNSEDTTEKEIITIFSPHTLLWSNDDFNDRITSFWGGDDDLFFWAEKSHENVKIDIFEASSSIQFHIEGSDPTEDVTVLGFEFKEILFDE